MSKPWFSQKRFGYGASFPISWEGWSIMAGYIALMIAAALIIENAQSSYRFLVIIPMLLGTLALVMIAKARTRGGWRWRWASED